jgi:hypothetical protein
MMENVEELSERVIDQIIERKEAHRYVKSGQFEAILNRAKSLIQVRHVFESLEQHGERNALIGFILKRAFRPDICF